jgi:hypothetical protein
MKRRSVEQSARIDERFARIIAIIIAILERQEKLLLASPDQIAEKLCREVGETP